MTPHKHTYDSDVMYVEASLITPTILACVCGAFAAIGDTEIPVKPMWEPEEVAA
jgi:hypothetical protein